MRCECRFHTKLLSAGTAQGSFSAELNEAPHIFFPETLAVPSLSKNQLHYLQIEAYIHAISSSVLKDCDSPKKVLTYPTRRSPSGIYIPNSHFAEPFFLFFKMQTSYAIKVISTGKDITLSLWTLLGL